MTSWSQVGRLTEIKKKSIVQLVKKSTLDQIVLLTTFKKLSLVSTVFIWVDNFYSLRLVLTTTIVYIICFSSQRKKNIFLCTHLRRTHTVHDFTNDAQNTQIVGLENDEHSHFQRHPPVRHHCKKKTHQWLSSQRLLFTLVFYTSPFIWRGMFCFLECQPLWKQWLNVNLIHEAKKNDHQLVNWTNRNNVNSTPQNECVWFTKKKNTSMGLNLCINYRNAQERKKINAVERRWIQQV